MLSYPGCRVRPVHWLYWNLRNFMSYLSILRNFWESCLNMKMRYLMVSKKKESISRVKVGWKICPLASLVMPNSDPWDKIFYPTLTPMMDFYSIYLVGRVLKIYQNTLNIAVICASTWQNLSLGFPKKQHSNHFPQLQRPARILKFNLWRV